MRQIGRPGQQAGEQVHHQRQAVALVAAYGLQEAVEGGTRVGGRAAEAVGGPGVGDAFAAIERATDFCPRHHAHRHVEHDRIAAGIGHAQAERIIAQARVAAAAGGDGGAGIAGDDAGKSRLRGNPGIRGDGAEMVAAAGKGHADAGFTRRRHRRLECARADQGADAVVAVDHGDGGRFFFDANRRPGVDAADFQPLTVGDDAVHAVGGQAEQVGDDKDARRIARILLREAAGLQRTRSEIEQPRFGDQACFVSHGGGESIRRCYSQMSLRGA